MMKFETSLLENGTRKATINAKDLVETAITLKSLDSISNRIGYSVLLMQTGLEEAAKASFLFEKFIRSLGKGQINISEREWKIWMGSRQSHSKRIARVQYLYALTEQVGSTPEAGLMFPQGVDEMLQNRNAALYVDFDSDKQDFVSPYEEVNPYHLTGNSAFAKSLLNFTSYDKLIDRLDSVVLNDSNKKNRFVKSIEQEIVRKKKDVWKEVDETKSQFSIKQGTFNKWDEVVFCARPRSDNIFELLYSCMVGTKDNSIFCMDKQTNHLAIHPDGRIIHARFAGTIQETPNINRHNWNVIEPYL